MRTSLCEDVIGLLSDDVTQNLPPDWQGISRLVDAESWLRERQNEGQVCAIYEAGPKNFVGLLFVYGYESGHLPRNIRIGYAIAQDLWGRGIASELVAGFLAYVKDLGGVTSVVGGVEKSNVGSSKVLTKNGFLLKDEVNEMAFYEYLL